jgi:hypothetical protein
VARDAQTSLMLSFQSKYMCCCEMMRIHSNVQLITPATTILPCLSSFVLNLMCFMPSIADVERFLSITGCNDTLMSCSLAPERLGAINVLHAN